MARPQMSAILPDFVGLSISHGPYHLHFRKRLGSGAYGVVYLAEDLAARSHQKRFYAVKCLLRHERGSVLARQQQREIALHRAMSSHSNVVSLHAVIEEEFYMFLVLDLVDGGDLFNAIIDRAAFANNDEGIKNTFLQIVDAVEACHAQGIFHRDLKPENILCSRDDQKVYLADFGLSTKTRLSANFGCGSSFYMSPECLGVFHKKRPYATGPSDVWALGTVLCNMVTGRNPWHIASPKTDDGFRHFLSEGAPFLRQHLKISHAASRLFARLFEVDPERRITIPQLRKAILAIDTFFPGAPSTSRTLTSIQESSQESLLEPTEPHAPEGEEDITEQNRPQAARGFHGESWEPRPIALYANATADFITTPATPIDIAATATCVATESTFVNGSDASSTDTLDEVWSVNGGPPAFAESPEPSYESESSCESDGPATPATLAADLPGAVPDLALDAHTPSECDITMAGTRLAELKTDKRASNPVVRLFTGMRIRMRA